MSRRLSIFSSSDVQPVKYLAIISCFFIFGAAAGVTSASALPLDSANDAVADSIGSRSFFDLFFSLSKYHFVSIAFGIMLFGFVFLPFLAAVKGFSLSFTSSCMLLSFGKCLLSLPFLVFFCSQLISVVILFLIMNAAMQMSAKLTSGFLTGAVPLKKLFKLSFLRPVFISILILFSVSFGLFFYSLKF